MSDDIVPKLKAEDSMSPLPELIMRKDRDDDFVPTIVQSTNDVLAQLITLNNDNVMHEPTCIICSSPYRDEIEKKWIETKSHEDVKKLVKERSHAKLSNDVIDNHVYHHYTRGVQELQKVEYVNKLKRMSSVELTTLDRIKLGCCAIEERLSGVNSIVPDNNLSFAEVEKIKSDAVTKLMGAYNNLIKLKATIVGEMQDSDKLVVVPKQEFVTIFNDALIEAKNDTERDVIKKILDRITELASKIQ